MIFDYLIGVLVAYKEKRLDSGVGWWGIKGVFKDWEAISPWARDSVKLASEKGLLKGDANGHYRPKDPVNREELAVVLARLLEVINRAG